MRYREAGKRTVRRGRVAMVNSSPSAANEGEIGIFAPQHLFGLSSLSMQPVLDRRDRPVDGVDSRSFEALGQLLRADAIARAIPEVEVEVVQETGSTNADLLLRSRQAQPLRPVLRAALVQTSGRGRLGRRWHARRGSALLFSLAQPLTLETELIAAATLACGVGAAEALRAAGASVALKWPNDLFFDGRKLGGILCELALDAAGRRTLIIGVGINLVLDSSMHGSIGQPVAALVEALPLAALLTRREALLAQVATAILDAVKVFEAEGFVSLQPRFMALFVHRDCMVDVIEQGVCVGTGRALGVDAGGRLLLATEQGLRMLSAGEVSLRVTT